MSFEKPKFSSEGGSASGGNKEKKETVERKMSKAEVQQEFQELDSTIEIMKKDLVDKKKELANDKFKIKNGNDQGIRELKMAIREELSSTIQMLEEQISLYPKFSEDIKEEGAEFTVKE